MSINQDNSSGKIVVVIYRWRISNFCFGRAINFQNHKWLFKIFLLKLIPEKCLFFSSLEIWLLVLFVTIPFFLGMGRGRDSFGT